MSGRRRHSDAFLAEIARQHAAHVKAGWPPARAVAVAYGIERQSATRWFAQCRAAGFELEASGHLRHHYGQQRGEQR